MPEIKRPGKASGEVPGQTSEQVQTEATNELVITEDVPQKPQRELERLTKEIKKSCV